MFVSLPQPGHGRPSITGFLSASQHCKHFGLPGGAGPLRGSATSHPTKETFPKLCHPQNFRVRKLKTVHRAHHWNSKSVSKLTVTTGDIEVFFRLLGKSLRHGLTYLLIQDRIFIFLILFPHCSMYIYIPIY